MSKLDETSDWNNYNLHNKSLSEHVNQSSLSQSKVQTLGNKSNHAGFLIDLKLTESIFYQTSKTQDYGVEQAQVKQVIKYIREGVQ